VPLVQRQLIRGVSAPFFFFYELQASVQQHDFFHYSSPNEPRASQFLCNNIFKNYSFIKHFPIPRQPNQHPRQGTYALRYFSFR
jgi:hypothetical protein